MIRHAKHEVDMPIVASGLTREYRQGEVVVHALRGLDISFGAAEFTALVGPSGSGKSTLLNLLGCLDSPTSGSIQISGRDVVGLSRSESAQFRLQHIGFVFQAYNLIPVLTAYENAEYTLLLRGVPKPERMERVTALLERVGLADMMHRRPHELSGGQQQRVAVVRAIAARPTFVLADEPTANLDSQTSAELLDLMYELNAENGVTFLFASHDPLVVQRATRVVRLLDGKMVDDESRT